MPSPARPALPGPERLDRLRRYCDALAHVRDPLLLCFETFLDGPRPNASGTLDALPGADRCVARPIDPPDLAPPQGEERSAREIAPACRPIDTRWLLLALALTPEFSPAAQGSLFRALELRLGPRVFQPSSMPFSDLQAVCATLPGLSAWTDRDQLPGILLSIGDFLACHGSPREWRTRFPSPAELVSTLASELFLFGRRSPYRVKAWRLARLLYRPTPDLAGSWHPAEDSPEAGRLRALEVPAPLVERMLSRLRWLPPGHEVQLPVVRQAWARALALALHPGDPSRLWIPLELFRRRRGPQYACEAIQGGCGNCPLERDCIGRTAPPERDTRSR